MSVLLSFCQQNYWSESGGWDGQKVGKRGGQMDGQPGGQEIGYGMVDGVGLCYALQRDSNAVGSK